MKLIYDNKEFKMQEGESIREVLKEEIEKRADKEEEKIKWGKLVGFLIAIIGAIIMIFAK